MNSKRPSVKSIFMSFLWRFLSRLRQMCTAVGSLPTSFPSFFVVFRSLSLALPIATQFNFNLNFVVVIERWSLCFFQCVVAHWIEKRIRNMEILEKVGIEPVRLFFVFLPPGRDLFQSKWPGKALLLCRTFQAACSTSSDDRLHYTPQTFAKKIVLQADINKTSESV